MKSNIVFLGNRESDLVQQTVAFCRIVEPEDYDVNLIKNATGIVAFLNEAQGERIEGLLVKTRFNPSSCHIPFFVWGREWKVMNSRFWPRLSGDVNSIFWNEDKFRRWYEDLSSGYSGYPERFEWSSFAELLIGLIKSGGAYGVINFRTSEKGQGVVGLAGETIVFCRARELEGEEAFFEMMTWPRGEFILEPLEQGNMTEVNINRPFFDLFAEYGFLLDECRHIFGFIRNLQDRVELKPDHCALDDKADRYFKGYERICRMIEEGKSIDEIISSAPLSALRSLNYLYRLICFGDVKVLSPLRKDEEKGEVASWAVRLVKKYRVLVVDDAPFFQRVLKRILERDHRLVVVDTAKDGIDCLEKLERHNPDVITLDIEMPRLDGLGALKRIMVRNPKPVVVLSAFTGETSRLTYEAFKYGAVDVIEKPRSYSASDLEQKEREILERVARSACIRVEQLSYVKKSHTGTKDLNISGGGSRLFFINYFGEGSFSHFLKALSQGGWKNLEARTICILPLTTYALQHLYRYMIEDYSIPMELLPEERVEINSGRVYLLGVDRLPRARLEGDRIFLYPGKEEYNDPGRFIESVVGEVVKSDLYVPVVSAISGSGRLADYLIRAVHAGAHLFFLNPQCCLFPDLAESLKKSGIGFEVDAIGEMVQIWAKSEDHFMRSLKDAGRQAQ